MAIQTATLRTAIATYYGTQTPYVALASTAPGASAGTELSGGSPAYARVSTAWGTAASSAITGAPAAQNVPSAATVAGINLMSASTGGTYEDGATVTSQPYSSQGTYQVVPTFTQS